MGHTIEAASSGRAKCRGCGQAIAKGELRLGERLPNPFAEEPSDDNQMTLWFHLRCGAYKRPEVWLEALDSGTPQPLEAPLAEELSAIAQHGIEHRRLPRVDGGQRAKSARARCRQCRDPIDKGAMRIKLVYYSEGRFEPSGFVHASCAVEYFGTADIVDRVRHFTPDLAEDDIAELKAALCP